MRIVAIPALTGTLTLGLMSGVAVAQTEQSEWDAAAETQHAATAGGGQDMTGPAEDVQEAVNVVAQMQQQDPELGSALAQAKGVFLIPDYATASLLIGGAGGEGVMLAQQEDGQWSSPVFYDVGSLSLGVQAGAAAGSIVMLLMSDEAVENFEQENNFSLNVEAGLTLLNWSAEAEADWGRGDVVVWTDTEGLLAEAAIGIADINFDEEETAEYYGQEVTPQSVLAGNIEDPQSETLRTEFAEFSAQSGVEARTE